MTPNTATARWYRVRWRYLHASDVGAVAPTGLKASSVRVQVCERVEGVEAVTVELPEDGAMVDSVAVTRGMALGLWVDRVNADGSYVFPDGERVHPLGQYALITDDGDELWRGWV